MAAIATTTGALPVRTASVERNTNETKIKCTLSLDVHPQSAPQTINVKTGIGFLDHVSALELQNKPWHVHNTTALSMALTPRPHCARFDVSSDAARSCQARRHVPQYRV